MPVVRVRLDARGAFPIHRRGWSTSVSLPPSALVVYEPGGGFAGDPIIGLSFGAKRADVLAAPVRPDDIDVPDILPSEFSRLQAWRVVAIGHENSTLRTQARTSTRRGGQFNIICIKYVHVRRKNRTVAAEAQRGRRPGLGHCEPCVATKRARAARINASIYEKPCSRMDFICAPDE